MDEKNGSPSGIQNMFGDSIKATLNLCSISRKEDDCSKYFKPSVAKRLKKEPERVEKEVKVEVGIVTMKDSGLSVKCGVTLPKNVSPKSNSEDLIIKGKLE